MAKVQQISELTPSFAFTEFDFYKDYEKSFKKSEIGRIHVHLPLHDMAVRFGLIDSHPRMTAGRKSYFSLMVDAEHLYLPMLVSIVVIIILYPLIKYCESNIPQLLGKANK